MTRFFLFTTKKKHETKIATSPLGLGGAAAVQHAARAEPEVEDPAEPLLLAPPSFLRPLERLRVVVRHRDLLDRGLSRDSGRAPSRGEPLPRSRSLLRRRRLALRGGRRGHQARVEVL